jgi:metal-sulfur cluster biosynthetic enzyme
MPNSLTPRTRKIVFFLFLVAAIATAAISQSWEPRLKSHYHWQRETPSSVKGIPGPSPAQVTTLLTGVYDPELPINIVDLGLIHKVDVRLRHVDLTMTLTTPNCPFAGNLIDRVRDALLADERVDSLELHLTMDPPWTVERLAPEVRHRLFGIDAGGRPDTSKKGAS